MRLPAWPRSLRGQMIALVLVGLAMAQALSFVLSSLQHRYAVEALHDENTLTRIASVVHILAETPQELHERVRRAVNSPLLQLTITLEPLLEIQADSPHGRRLQYQLATLLHMDNTDIRVSLRSPVTPHGDRPPHPPGPGHAPRHPRPSHDDHENGPPHPPGHRHGPRPPHWSDDSLEPEVPHPPGPGKDPGPRRSGPPAPPRPALAVAVRLGEGRWLHAVSASPAPLSFWQWPMFLSLGCAALILSGLMILMVRRITRPLAHLALAADRLGRGEAGVPLTEQGPRDVQETVRAFNHMQARLARFVQDRTRMLAAMSHDLRTPLTALRVRAELLDDLEVRDKIIATLDEMQRITEATLAFMREEATEEDTRRLDLDALIASVCDDLSDVGQDVTYTGSDRTLYRGRSVGLRRALVNLIENAVIYGQRARVTLTEEPEALCITIDDDGPGIATSDMERVFEPFVRLETSRSRDTGGVGLGMAIARSIVQGHGGEIALDNRAAGGLRVTVRLPKGLAAA